MQPSTAFAPPDSPVRAPWGTTGTSQRDATCRTAETSAVEVARTSAAGVPAGQNRAWSEANPRVMSGSETTEPRPSPAVSARTRSAWSAPTCSPQLTASAPVSRRRGG